MGLDIIGCRVIIDESEINKDTPYIRYTKDETNKNILSFFKHFEKYIHSKDEEFLDFEKLFEEHKLKYDDFNLLSYGTEENGKVMFTFENISNKDETISFEEIIIPIIIENIQVIYYENTNFYQRKGMKENFYSQYLSGCWYVADSKIDKDDGILFAFTDELVEKAKTFAEKNTPIKKFKLSELEFLDFDY